MSTIRSESALNRVVAELDALSIPVVERSHRQARPEVRAAVPEGLHGAAQARAEAIAPKGLWRHQAEALEAYAQGASVVLSTSTSSGKSLVFQLAGIDQLCRAPESKVLVLYPIKALIDDQLPRWEEALAPLGLHAARIHGEIAVADRPSLLERNHVILATPDIVHAWMLRVTETQPFFDNLKLLVLDEAHAYDGAFGSNMVYMLHRLRATSAIERVVATTATLADPVAFLESLTGLRAVHIGADREGAPSQGRHFLRVAGSFSHKADLVARLAKSRNARFLAFADSRKAVERLVEEAHRRLVAEGVTAEERVLPYRSGFESEDREAIQKALSRGRLRGVVSTSALELGIDIGDIDTVLLLTIPGTQRSVWQRAGRAGRGGKAGVCVVWDDGRAFRREGLDAWLDRPIEPSRLYLHNRLIQFGHAVCAAWEVQRRGKSVRREVFAGLPARFSQMLDNELEPSAALPEDCLAVKSRLAASDAPHFGLPLRAADQDRWQVQLDGSTPQKLGWLDTAQMMREAYPGAIYRYMARSYRITALLHRSHEIQAHKARRGVTTEPIRIVKVFPRLPAGMFARRSGPSLEVMETQLQVSERLLGFRERTGSASVEHVYGVGNAYAQQALTRQFNTTGVVWFGVADASSDGLCAAIRRAFCARFEVAEGDVGCGDVFHRGSDGSTRRGLCLFDATAGSLRLTTPLVEGFADVVADAVLSVEADEEALRTELELLATAAQSMGETRAEVATEVAAQQELFEQAGDGGTLRVIAPGQEALLVDGTCCRDVKIVGYSFGPLGLLYELRNGKPGTWKVPAARVKPRADCEVWLEVDAVTGEVVEERAA